MRILVTGGPTRAYLDRVRFLTNVSTGSLAFELCRLLKKRGYKVCAILGPTALNFERLGLEELHHIETTDEMHDVVMKCCRSFRPEAAIFSAAVLDFAPSQVGAGKVSSSRRKWSLTLVPTPKILEAVGHKFPKIRRIGFKLEWEKKTGKALQKFALDYLGKRGLEALCVNFLPEVGPSAHKAYLFSKDGLVAQAENKAEIARGILKVIRDGSH